MPAVLPVNFATCFKRHVGRAVKRRRPGRGMAGGLGNAALADPELPSADVIAADQRITAIAQALNDAGAAGAWISSGRRCSARCSPALTMPASAWPGCSDSPGEVAGFGPVDADACRDLAQRLAAGPGYPVVPDPDRPGRAGRGARLRLRPTGASHLRLPPAPGSRP